MKKNFTNPEIKITLFNQERVHTTDGGITVGQPTMEPTTVSGVETNYNNAVKWITDNKIPAGNIFSYKN